MKRIDLFGSQIMFRFKGNSSLQTGFGSIVSMVIIAIVMIRLAYIIIDVSNRRNPNVISSERQVSSPQEFNFSTNNVTFAFGLQDSSSVHYINPSVYNVTVKKTKRTNYYNSTTKQQDVKYTSKYIYPSACTETSFKGTATEDYFLKLSYKDMYCFNPSDDLIIEGDFSQEVFQYFSITISKCLGTTCADETKIKQLFTNGNFAIYQSDVIFSPENKQSPFTEYPRDMYWIVNQEAAKTVNYYYHNTYIQSDFGWIYEDIDTQRFAQFSSADVTYLPSSFTDYAFKILVRFEKQKEQLHKRKYKNINSIISEIGGFTQTMLAIGFLICSRYSQLELNKNIINSAFNFEGSEFTQSNSPTNPPHPQLKNDVIHFSDVVTQLQQGANAKATNNNNNNNNKSTYDPTIGITHSVSFQSPKPAEHMKDNQKSPSGSLIISQQYNSFSNTQSKLLLSKIIRKKVIKRKSGETPTENLKSANNQDNEAEVSESRFKKLMNQVRGQISLNVWEYAKYLLWPFGKVKEKKKIIDYGIDKLYYHLDLLNVIKKLLEVDKLKRLLMDDDQLSLFECIPKPIIRTADALKDTHQLPTTAVQAGANGQHTPSANPSYQTTDLLYQDTRSDIQKTQSAYSSYLRINSKIRRSDMDQKLLNLMDRNLLHLFELDLNQNYEESQDNSQKGDQPIQLNAVIPAEQSSISQSNDLQSQNFLRTPAAAAIETQNNLLSQSNSNVFEFVTRPIKQVKNTIINEECSHEKASRSQELSIEDGDIEAHSVDKIKRFPVQYFKTKVVP